VTWWVTHTHMGMGMGVNPYPPVYMGDPVRLFLCRGYEYGVVIPGGYLPIAISRLEGSESVRVLPMTPQLTRRKRKNWLGFRGEKKMDCVRKYLLNSLQGKSGNFVKFSVISWTRRRQPIGISAFAFLQNGCKCRITTTVNKVCSSPSPKCHLWDHCYFFPLFPQSTPSSLMSHQKSIHARPHNLWHKVNLFHTILLYRYNPMVFIAAPTKIQHKVGASCLANVHILPTKRWLHPLRSWAEAADCLQLHTGAMSRTKI
jgi:hypothetical protein